MHFIPLKKVSIYIKKLRKPTQLFGSSNTYFYGGY